MSHSPDRKDAIMGEIEKANEGPTNLHEHTSYAAIDKMPASLAELSPEDRQTLEKKVKRKIDLTLLPILMTMYILNYLDRNNIAAARLYGITEDTGLVGTQYQTVISILFASYILFQVPSNMLASRVKYPGVYLNVMMGCWGVVSAATAAAHSFTGLIIIRLILGIFEAAFFPGAVFLLSCWYTKKELASRTAILYAGSQLGNAFGTLIARGILTLDGAHGLAGWRWLFIIEGVATFGLSCIFAVLLPNMPGNSWQFSQVQRDMAVWRLEVEAGDISEESSVSGMQGFMMAVKDIKTYYFMGILSLTYVAGAVNSFFPTVVKTLGFSSNNTLLLTAPPFLLCTVVMYAVGVSSDRTGNRCWHVVGPLIITIVSMVMAISSTKIGVRYTAMLLMPCSFYSAAIVTLTWISNSMPRPAQKRAAAYAFINSLANTPNIWCSYLYQSQMGPQYLEAFSTNIAACGIAIVLAILLRFHLQKENKKLDAGHLVKGVSQEMLDLGWRYKI